ncbi:MAG: hypothetical protein R3F60_18150 [bacterium]
MKYAGLIALLALWGCIEEGSSAADDLSPDADGADVGAVADAAVDATAPIADAAPTPLVDAATPRPDATPPPDDACEAFCDRLDECLVPACPGLGERARAGICDGACQQPADRLRAATAGTCEAFNARLFAAVPQLGPLCEEAPPLPDACAARCDRANACGLGIPPRQCAQFCSQTPARLAECLDAAPDCDAFTACLDAPPAPGQCEALCALAEECGFASAADCAAFCADIPPPVRDCAAAADTCPALGACFQGPRPTRRSSARPTASAPPSIFRECAAGSLPDGCRPARRRLRRQSTYPGRGPGPPGCACRDVVAERRAQDAALDAACDADPAAACEALCADTIGPAPTPSPTAWPTAPPSTPPTCALRPARPRLRRRPRLPWRPEGQARCAHPCGRLQSCLEEACPPRIIPPELSVHCTAGCPSTSPHRRAARQRRRRHLRRGPPARLPQQPRARPHLRGRPRLPPQPRRVRRVLRQWPASLHRPGRPRLLPRRLRQPHPRRVRLRARRPGGVCGHRDVPGGGVRREPQRARSGRRHRRCGPRPADTMSGKPTSPAMSKSPEHRSDSSLPTGLPDESKLPLMFRHCDFEVLRKVGPKA